jgi:hypothetical protein
MARRFILFGTTADLGLEFGSLISEADLRLDQDLQRRRGFFGRATWRILYSCALVRCVMWNWTRRLP